MSLLDTSRLQEEAEPVEPGSLSVLNCGAGDLKFRFDKDDPAEVEQAKRVLEDMLRRGYTILVEVDGELRRAKRFDPAKNCYVVTEPPAEQPYSAEQPVGQPKKRGRPRTRQIPLKTARATAIAPTAGG